MSREPDTQVSLDHLALRSGQGRRLDLAVEPGGLEFGGHRYEPAETPIDARLDVSRTVSGYALRLRYTAEIAGPCMKCLEPARLDLTVDSREVDQPEEDLDEDDLGATVGDELQSPYIEGGSLDLSRWAHDALVLTLPEPILCDPACPGLCPVCGERLTDGPHDHEEARDPRWSALRGLGSLSE